ncbi:ypbF [Bacillus pumilus SAFR-032]|uniref:YpbF n=1 Tax=Bacillus pumilus (strain SAFR-032) TaxID=315750 RepID=A8FEN5_BACP2|nr:ypbF [Bacillus pumilus SAFR-032]
MTLHAISRYMDQPTQKMMETLIKRKLKYEGFAKQCKRWQWTALLSLAILLFYFVITANKGGSLQPEAMIATLLGHEVFLFWIMAEVFAFYASYYYKKKEEKAEDEYHRLRCEIITKKHRLMAAIRSVERA